MTLLRMVLGAALDTAQTRKGIRQYKYVSPPLSLGERLFLNGFWDRVAQCYPPWLAPNVVTLLGGLCVLVGSALLFAYSPQLRGTAPAWVYLANAVLLFGYQTCDGSDGKQARRTGAGSPLGHLFDHGLDSMVSTLVATWTVDLLGQGTQHLLFPLLLAMGQLAFFLSNLVCVHKGSQLFYSLDVQELQLVIMAALVSKAALGRALWDFPTPVMGYSHPLWLWFAGASICAVVNNCVRYTWNVLLPYAPGASSPTGRGLVTAVGHLFVPMAYCALAFVNLQGLPSIVHPVYLASVVTFSGLVMSLLMVVVAGTAFPLLHWALVAQALLLAAGDNPLAQWATAAGAAACYAHYVGQIIGTLKQELGIFMFRIRNHQNDGLATPMRSSSPPPPAFVAEELSPARSSVAPEFTPLSGRHGRDSSLGIDLASEWDECYLQTA